MKDLITVRRIELLHPEVRGEVYKIYDEICDEVDGVRFTHTLRTFQQQNDLYAIGRTKTGMKVTNAKAGQSYHNYGLAIDIAIIKDGKALWDRHTDFDGDKIPDWMEVVKIFESYGWEWGGRWAKFPDYPHFQKTFGKKTSELLKMKKHAGTTYPIL